MRATSSLVVARTREELRSELQALREVGRTVSLVPTMGSLHSGHLSLIDRAGELSDVTIVSIFVNRLQFGQGEDFSAYPQDLERDLEVSAAHGVRLVFAPTEEVIYPRGEPRIQVDPGEMGERLCGAFRPGHFRGVLTVVAKLFGLIGPDWALFGRKDFQQAILVRQMVEDLELGVRIEVAPLVRDSDGMALSSRNVYLNGDQRRDASGIWQALSAADELFRAGQTRSTRLLEEVRLTVSTYPGIRLQYAEAVNPETLQPVERAQAGTVIAIAAFCGETRLIDNVVLGQSAPDPLVEGGAPEESSG